MYRTVVLQIIVNYYATVTYVNLWQLLFSLMRPFLTAKVFQGSLPPSPLTGFVENPLLCAASSISSHPCLPDHKLILFSACEVVVVDAQFLALCRPTRLLSAQAIDQLLCAGKLGCTVLRIKS